MWSLTHYCEGQAPIDLEALSLRYGSTSTLQFLLDLNLPSVHPFCHDDAPSFARDDVPPMGPLDRLFDGQTSLEMIVTLWYMYAPTRLAKAELWLRLFAGLIGPVGTLYLGILVFGIGESSKSSVYFKKGQESKWILTCQVLLSLTSCAVVMTDTLYVLHNGPMYGAILFVTSVAVSLRACYLFNLPMASVGVACLVVLSVVLVWDGETDTITFGNRADHVHNIPEGLYYDHSNSYVSSIVSHWPETYRTYDKAHGATQWMPTGDSRTGLPFVLNNVPKAESYRVFLETNDDGDYDDTAADGKDDVEYVALDISFPPTGHDRLQPIYFVLHGMNGGKDDDYIRDLTLRRTKENSTVVVMVARGMMDLPVRG
jgi:hypothetical protein